jgi:alkylhydroperoxidase/carboxymuconolactone decarboxylase family protein YurZ
MKNFIIQDIYGKLLSNFSLLSFEETELIVITSLLALNVPPQLKSHLIGAKNAGISKELLDQLQEVFKQQ